MLHSKDSFLKPKFFHFKSLTLGLSLLLAFFVFPSVVKATDISQQLQVIQEQIRNLEETIAQKNQEAFSIQNELAKTEDQIKKNDLEIQSTETQMSQLANLITFTDKAIERNRLKLIHEKKVLAELVRSLYDQGQQSTLEVFLQQYELADYVRASTGLGTLEGEVYNTIKTVKEVRAELERQQVKNASRQQELQALASTLQVQKQELALAQEKQKVLLDQKLQEKNAAEARLAVIKYIESQVNKGVYDLNNLKTNLPLTEAFRLARLVSERTGVRPALILGLIQQESNFNPLSGGGRYPDDVHPDHRDALVRVATKLGLDVNTVPVSRRPTNYQGWGGAMGAAQVMPSKWESIESNIAGLMGKAQVSPWNIDDSFMAAGFILQGLGAKAYDRGAETQACGRYFAGGNWERYPWYAEQVLAKAAIYEERLKNSL